MPPIVENPDILDFKIGGDTNQVGPGVSYNDNPEELLDTIYMNHIRIHNIEPAGFQTLEHCFYSPSFLISREGFLRAAEGDEDLWLRLPVLVLDDGAGQVAELSADPVDAMQDTFFPVFEIGEDMLGFAADELPVRHQALDAGASEQPDEPLHDIYSLLAVGVPAFGQEPEQDWEQHVIIRYAQD